MGAEGVPTYIYRGETVNSGLKMAASEVNLFKDRAEVTHKMDFSDLSDDELLNQLRDETEALIRERAERLARENGDGELTPRWRSGRAGTK
jgi:hypothetical protein